MELDSLHEELSTIIQCKNGTIATLAEIRDKLKFKTLEECEKNLEEMKTL